MRLLAVFLTLILAGIPENLQKAFFPVAFPTRNNYKATAEEFGNSRVFSEILVLDICAKIAALLKAETQSSRTARSECGCPFKYSL